MSSIGSYEHPGYPTLYVRIMRDVTYSGAWALSLHTIGYFCDEHKTLSVFCNVSYVYPPVFNVGSLGAKEVDDGDCHFILAD